nr:hypothetical protein [uncultured Dyadobacter sp.]
MTTKVYATGAGEQDLWPPRSVIPKNPGHDSLPPSETGRSGTSKRSSTPTTIEAAHASEVETSATRNREESNFPLNAHKTGTFRDERCLFYVYGLSNLKPAI